MRELLESVAAILVVVLQVINIILTRKTGEKLDQEIVKIESLLHK